MDDAPLPCALLFARPFHLHAELGECPVDQRKFSGALLRMTTSPPVIAPSARNVVISWKFVEAELAADQRLAAAPKRPKTSRQPVPRSDWS